jgi:L,D-transpeptidase catalytic domain
MCVKDYKTGVCSLHLLYACSIFTLYHVSKSYTPLKKLFIYLLLPCLAILITSFSPLPAPKEKTVASAGFAVSPFRIDAKEVAAQSALLYDELNLIEKGLSKEAFDYAYKGYQYLLFKGMVSQPGYLTICDFSQSSKQKRLYLIDIANNKIVLNTFVAHGRNSGCEYASKFSNKLESLQSSLGFYITKSTYSGEHGLSLRVEGLEPGFNDKAYQRAIVIHGAKYIGSGCTGRSYGCPAVPQKESKKIINTIKNGTCLFVYYPEKKYLKSSKILNG